MAYMISSIQISDAKMPPWHCHNYLAQYFYILDIGTTVLINCNVVMMDRYQLCSEGTRQLDSAYHV